MTCDSRRSLIRLIRIQQMNYISNRNLDVTMKRGQLRRTMIQGWWSFLYCLPSLFARCKIMVREKRIITSGEAYTRRNERRVNTENCFIESVSSMLPKFGSFNCNANVSCLFFGFSIFTNVDNIFLFFL